METRQELEKKIALCDKLGASKFQPYVLKLEQLKFKVLKDIFPSIQTRYEKHLRKNRDKALKKAKSQKERDQISANYRQLVIEWRKELKREQNRNYHMDENKPTEILQYLNWNKKVHQKGLIKDGILFAGTVAGLAIGVAPVFLAPALFYEAASAYINFQCINIQNSHIYRYKIIEKSLERRERTKNKKLIENYGQAAEVYSRCIADSIDVPTIQEMIANVKTPEEAQQLRKMLLERIERNKKSQGQTSPNEESKQLESKDDKVITQEENGTTTITASQEMSKQADLEIERMVAEGNKKAETISQKQIGGRKIC